MRSARPSYPVQRLTRAVRHMALAWLVGRRAHRVVLSPHLDDAVLSLGGSAHRWSRAGERVVVLTVFTADPPSAGLSSFAQELHRRWGATDRQAYALRRAEDRAAMATLGLGSLHLNWLDCIYRESSGQTLYPDVDSLFGPVHAADQGMVRVLRQELVGLLRWFPSSRPLYVPLGIGGHVDHVIVRCAAEALGRRQLVFYEDFPYSRDPQAVAAAAKGHLAGPAPSCFDREALVAKLRAIGCYGSQLAILFGSRRAMVLQVLRSARRCGEGVALAECLWLPAAMEERSPSSDH